MCDSPQTIFTVGHSTHDWEDFIGLLRQHGITAVADVRSQPYAWLPQYNRDTLTSSLEQEDIRYVPLGRELGARRHEPECYVDGQADYKRVAELPLFREGLERLAAGTRKHRIAIMCAEKEPLDCHRTILVCRHLRPFGLRIRHILADGTLEEHADTEERLKKQMKLFPDLFLDDEVLTERAYDLRGEKIAYRIDTEEASNE